MKLRILDISGLVQSSTLNSKLTELERKITTAGGKIPDITNIVHKTQLTAIVNNIPDIKNLLNKTELKNVECKIPDIKNLVSKSELTTVENKIPANVSNKKAE